MLSRPGLLDFAVEFVVFFPLTAFAMWPSRLPRAKRPTPAAGVPVRAAPSLAASAVRR